VTVATVPTTAALARPRFRDTTRLASTQLAFDDDSSILGRVRKV
jgi:hypothetical protein